MPVITSWINLSSIKVSAQLPDNCHLPAGHLTVVSVIEKE
jgi:hypothetical protein